MMLLLIPVSVIIFLTWALLSKPGRGKKNKEEARAMEAFKTLCESQKFNEKML